MRALFVLAGLSACQHATLDDTADPSPHSGEPVERAFAAAAPGRFLARHPGWGYRLTAAPVGLQIEDRGATFALRLARWGRDEADHWLPPRPPEALDCATVQPTCAETLVTLHPGGLTEWLENTAAGPAQRWTLEEAPAGDGPLRLVLEVEGATLRTDGRAVFLQDTQGQGHRYHQLAAADAAGRPLPARFDLAEGEIHILVDDTDAVWPIDIDPVLDNVADLTLTGSAGSELGLSVSAAGDVNNDGYADLIVGQPGTSPSSAALHLGAATLNTTVDLTFSGAAGSRFGAAVAGGRDLNGDGYDDLAVGAPEVSSKRGAVYVYFGGATPNSTVDLTLTSATPSGQLGTALAMIPDLNGDGVDDLAAGAPYEVSQRGGVRLYYGGATMDNVADLTLTGASTSSRFGFALAGLGDINADGFGDLLVGAPIETTNRGTAYVYLGGAAPDTTADHVLAGPSAAAYFGTAVAGVGDLNGDGAPDFAVGAPGDASGYGTVSLYEGGPAVDAVADLTFTGVSLSAGFGSALAGTGDVNGDGEADLLVGVKTLSSRTGEARLFHGGPALDSAVDLLFSGSSTNSDFGAALAGVGDLDGDDGLDLLIAAPATSSNQGQAQVYRGSPLDRDADGVLATLDCDDSDPAVGLPGPRFVDADADGEGSTTSATACPSATGYADTADDCDDTDPAIGAPQARYADGDADGLGAGASATVCVTLPGYAAGNTDCDDTDPAIGAPTLRQADADADGLGDASSTATVCPSVAGYVDDASDCDDTDADIGAGSSRNLDADGDGLGATPTAIACPTAPGFADNADDCDDTSPAIGAASLRNLDDDSDGLGGPSTATVCPGLAGYADGDTDCDDTDPAIGAASPRNLDADGDGLGGTPTAAACPDAAGFADNADDCNDADPAVGAAAPRYPDLDGDGLGDAAASLACADDPAFVDNANDCDDSDPAVGAAGLRNVDADGDGLGSALTDTVCPGIAGYADNSEDCDDADPSAGAAISRSLDADADGWGSTLGATVCPDAPGYADNSEDCDDADPAVGPPAARNLDSDGDGLGGPTTDLVCPTTPGHVDNADDCDDTDPAAGAPTSRYPDGDGDGFGDALSTLACPSDPAFADNGDDCDDSDPLITLGLTAFPDSDGDGFGDPAGGAFTCSLSPGWVADNTDCLDSDPSAYPGASDLCGDGVDSDCDAIGDDLDDDEDGDGISAGQEAADNATLAAAGLAGATADDCVDDDDGDGRLLEGRTDADFDDIPDYLDNVDDAYAVINGGKVWTHLLAVTLSYSAPDGADQLCVTNSPAGCAATATGWVAATGAPLAHTLTPGVGQKTVYTRFRNSAAPTVISTRIDRIGLDTARPLNGTVTIEATTGAVSLRWSGFSDRMSGLALQNTYVVTYEASTTAPVSCRFGEVATAGTTDTAITVNGLTDGTPYTFRICALDEAGNLGTGVVVSEIPNLDQVPPVGTVTFLGGAAYTASVFATLDLQATDDASTVSEMCLSTRTTCTAFVPFSPTATTLLSLISGTKTIYAWFKDSAGNVSAPVSDTIVLDTTRPVDGTLFANPGAGAIHLTWLPASDAHSGLASYVLVYQPGATAPRSCSPATGVTRQTGITGTAATISGLPGGAPYAFRLCAVDQVGNVSVGRTGASTPFVARLAVDTPEADDPAEVAAAGLGCRTVASPPSGLALAALAALALRRRRHASGQATD